jgi:cytochrome c553
MSKQDVAALAEHYAALVPPAAAPSAGSEAGRALADRLQCASCHGSSLQGTSVGAARLAGQKPRSTAWSLQLMRSGARPHGSGAKPDPLLAALSNEEIESLAAYFASLR